MEFFVYRSTALVAPASPESRAILTTSIRNNAAVGLTGFLHREGDTFVQYLEGEPRPLWRCFDRIAADPRHCGLILLGQGHAQRRQFADWRMGYADEAVASFVDFLGEASATHDIADATARDALAFMRGVSQRIDLGLIA